MVGGLRALDDDLFDKWHCVSCSRANVSFIRAYGDLTKAQALLAFFLDDAFHHPFTVCPFLGIVRQKHISY